MTKPSPEHELIVRLYPTDTIRCSYATERARARIIEELSAFAEYEVPSARRVPGSVSVSISACFDPAKVAEYLATLRRHGGQLGNDPLESAPDADANNPPLRTP